VARGLAQALAAMILIFPAQREQMLMSMLKTRLRSLAQDMRFVKVGLSCSAAASAPATGSAEAKTNSSFFFGIIFFLYL